MGSQYCQRGNVSWCRASLCRLGAIVLLCLGLAACGGGGVGKLVSFPLSETVASGDETGDETRVALSYGAGPVAAYMHFARRIRTCWLAPPQPLLPEHKFFAEVPAMDARSASLSVHRRARDGKRGLKAFAMNFQKEGKGSAIQAQVYPPAKPLAPKMLADIRRWAKGGEGC